MQQPVKLKAPDKRIKALRFVHPTAQELRTGEAPYSRRWPSTEKRMLRLFLAIIFSVPLLVAKAAEPVFTELPPDQESAALTRAEATGFAIYRHDRAAAIATDAALKIRAFRKERRVRGWITEEQNGDIVVTFVDDSPAALYRAVVSDSGGLIGSVSVFASPLPLTSFESGAAAARKAALAAKFELCSDKYNSVVLPASDGGTNGWVVYLLPATTKNNIVPLGGTYRVETDGSTVTSQRGFTRTCIALPNDPRAVGLMITHLLDATPTEAHVFWSIWANKTMYVSTTPNGTLWSIEGGKIKLVKRGEKG